MFVFYQNITHDAPEILPVCTEWMLQVGLDIAPLRLLDAFERFGLLFLVVQRRQQPRLCAGAQLLQFGCVEAEKLARQGPYPYQFHLTFQHVDDHRQLVEPGFAQERTHGVHPVVVVELACLVKLAVFIHIFLQIFAVGVHCAKLVYCDYLAVFAHTFQLGDGRRTRHTFGDGVLHLARQHAELAVCRILIQHFESGVVQPSQYLYPVERAVFPLGDGEIPKEALAKTSAIK